MQDAFGFAEEAEFKRLIAQTAKMLPDKEPQDKFKEAASEIKTVDGLSNCLNEMFTKYGDTLPLRLHDFDHAGQRSMWLRVEGKTMNALDVIGSMCIDKNRTVDDIMGGLCRSIAKGEARRAGREAGRRRARRQVAEGSGGRADQGQPRKGRRAMIKEKPHSKAYLSIKALGPDMMGIIDDRLAAGEPSPGIADWIKKECGQLADILRPLNPTSFSVYSTTSPPCPSWSWSSRW